MSEIKSVFDVAARAMSAQMQRMNSVASNVANMGTVSGSAETAFQPIRPVFGTIFANEFDETGLSTVDVQEIVSLSREPQKLHQPDHPLADEDGYVYGSAVDIDEEMVEMLEASRQYQNNLEVISTLRSLMARTVSMGK